MTALLSTLATATLLGAVSFVCAKAYCDLIVWLAGPPDDATGTGKPW